MVNFMTSNFNTYSDLTNSKEIKGNRRLHTVCLSKAEYGKESKLILPGICSFESSAGPETFLPPQKFLN